MDVIERNFSKSNQDDNPESIWSKFFGWVFFWKLHERVPEGWDYTQNFSTFQGVATCFQ